jgi:hypothetical protein
MFLVVGQRCSHRAAAGLGERLAQMIGVVDEVLRIGFAA